MRCPKCKKGELQEHIAKVGMWAWSRKTVYTYFCPLCNYETKKEIKMTWSEFQSERWDDLCNRNNKKVDVRIVKK